MIYIEKILLDVEPKKENLLETLRKISDAFGYVSEDDAKKVAEYFSLPLSAVFETASFYDLIETKKQPVIVVKVCSGSNCTVNGGSAILREVEKYFGIKAGDDFNLKVKLEVASCLGECGNGPVMIVNGTVYENVKPEKVDEILKNYA